MHNDCSWIIFLLSVGDCGCGNSLRIPHVREAGVAARRRPFSGGGLGWHVLYLVYRTTEGRPDPCARQGLVDGLRRGPRPRLSGRSRRKSSRKATVANSDAETVATAGIPPVGVVVPGAAAKMVEMATTTIAARVTTSVVQVGEARQVLVMAEDAAEETTSSGGGTAALEEAPEGGEIARVVVQRGTARPPPSARLPARARTTAR